MSTNPHRVVKKADRKNKRTFSSAGPGSHPKQSRIVHACLVELHTSCARPRFRVLRNEPTESLLAGFGLHALGLFIKAGGVAPQQLVLRFLGQA